MPDETKGAAMLTPQRARQKKIVTVVGALMIVAGLVILFALRRVPLPMRVMAGLGDVFIGCVLLVLVRQKFEP
jgi:nitrate reductase gamma subunit